MNKLIALLLATAVMSVGCATKPYVGQTWYATCKLNPNAVYTDEHSGKREKCTDQLRIRQ